MHKSKTISGKKNSNSPNSGAKEKSFSRIRFLVTKLQLRRKKKKDKFTSNGNAHEILKGLGIHMG